MKALGDSREFLASPSNETACTTSVVLENEVIFQEEHSFDAPSLLQKPLLEKQWGLSFDLTTCIELQSAMRKWKLSVQGNHLLGSVD